MPQAAMMKSVRSAEASDARFAALVAAQSDAVVVVGRNGVVRFANPSAERLFGRSLDELVGGPAPFALDAERVEVVLA